MDNKRIMNKKAFLARYWVIAFTVGIATISLGYLMVQGLATNYDNLDVIDPTFQSTYNKYSEMEGNIDEMFTEASSEEGLSVFGTVTVLFNATFTIIQIIFASILLPGAMLKQFSLDIGAPSLVSNIIFTLPILVVTIMIVLVVLSSVSKGRL